MADANRSGNSRKTRVESALPNTYFEISESGGKRRKKYVDHPKDSSKPICLIRGPVHSSYEFKVMGDYCSKCTKVRPTKDRGHNPTKKRNLIGRNITMILLTMQWIKSSCNKIIK